MKIGIMTFHWADNLGAVLQAYALSEFLRSKGYDAEIINYRPKPPVLKRRNRLVVLMPLRIVKSVLHQIFYNNIYFFRYRKQALLFNKFRENQLKISARLYNTSYDISGYDVLITGSDQVWNANIVNDDPAYFLTFRNKNVKTISYAASIGEDDPSERILSYISKNLPSIDFISVREKGGINTLKKFTNKPITHVLDPVFLPEVSLWERLGEGKRLIEKKYILVYSVSMNDELYRVAVKVCEKLNMEAYVVQTWGKQKNYKNVSNRFAFNASPSGFINLIINAEFVVTDSFHGTAFSILLNKNFIVLPPLIARKGRLSELLESLMLDSRIIENANDINDINPITIDFSAPNRLLAEKKLLSVNFLENVLNHEPN